MASLTLIKKKVVKFQLIGYDCIKKNILSKLENKMSVVLTYLKVKC